MAHQGECFCGAVKIETNGEPEGMGYCHCRSCRSWSGGPVNGFTFWKPENVRVTAGAKHVGVYNKTPVSDRTYCTKCGGHLMTKHQVSALSTCSPPHCRRWPSFPGSTSIMPRPFCR